jgi:hypothetical protein
MSAMNRRMNSEAVGFYRKEYIELYEENENCYSSAVLDQINRRLAFLQAFGDPAMK